MGTPGQIVGGIVGGVVGSLIPGVGTIIGFTIGLGIGTFIDPPKIEEPEATPFAHQDLQFNTFQRNLPVPIVYGVNRVGGNILFIGNTRSEIREHQAAGAGGGGKGIPSAPDPPTVQEQIFHADFACALSEGPIAGVARTWIDEDEITDREGISFTQYLGTATQNPDSHVVTALGSDAPAFRNTAYSLFSGELGQVNRIPVVSQKISGVFGSISDGGNKTLEVAGQNRVTALECFEEDPNICLAWAAQYSTIHRSIDAGKSTDGWTTVVGSWANSGLTTDHRMAIHKGVAGRAYALGGAGMAIRTEDQGLTWGNSVSIVGGANDTIQFFVPIQANSSVVLAFGGKSGGVDFRGTIYRSADGGVTWSNVFSSGAGGLNSWGWGFEFPGTGVLVAGGGNTTTCYRSTDDGATWSAIGGGCGSDFSFGGGGVAFDENIGVGGGTANIVRTADRGLTWTSVYSNVAGQDSIQFKKGLGGVLFYLSRTADPEFLASTDAGSSWTTVVTATFAGDNRDFFLNENNFCIGGGSAAFVACQRYTIPTSCGNPGPIIKDFLATQRYALGLPESRLDLDTFASAAEYCAAPVRDPDGNFEQRFCLDIVIDRGKPILDHLRDMLSTFRGFLQWSQGTVKLRIEKAEAVSQAFDMGNIVEGSFTWRKQSYRDRPNVVKVQYIEPGDDDEYRLDFAQAMDDWDIDQTGERRERIFRLIGIKRRSQAQRMAQFYLDQAIHINNACSFRVGIGALKSEVGDVMEVSHDVPAWTKKKFRIKEIEEAPDDELTLTNIEYNEAVYGDEGEEGQADLSIPFNAFAVPYHAGRLDVHQRPDDSKIELSLTRIASNDLVVTQRLFRQRGDGEFEAIGQGLPFAPTAFVESEVRTFTHITTGQVPGEFTPTSGFTDAFSRANVNSPGTPWVNVADSSDIWRIQSHTLQRGDTASIGGVSDTMLVYAQSKTIDGDFLAIAKMFDSSGTVVAPGAALMGRWQPGFGSSGQFYGMEYAARTSSMEITQIDIIKVLSGYVTSTLSSWTGSGYFTIPGSPTEFRMRMVDQEIVCWLNSAEIVRASDSAITGEGFGGVAWRDLSVGGNGDVTSYVNVVVQDSPWAYWRLDEPTNSTTAADHMGSHHAAYATFAGITWGNSLIEDSNAAIHIRSSSTCWNSRVQILNDIRSFKNPTFSFELWVESENFFKCASSPVMAGFANDWFMQVRRLDGNAPRFYTEDIFGNGQAVGATTSLEANTRYHLVGIRDVANDYQAIFVNATLEGSAALTQVDSRIETDFNDFALGVWLNFPSVAHYYTGKMDEPAYYPFALTSAQIHEHYVTGIGSPLGGGGESVGQGERWDDFEWNPLAASSVNLRIRGVPDGWSARLFNPNSTVVAANVASDGEVRMNLVAVSQPISGFLLLFTDGLSYSVEAESPRYPGTGNADFFSADIYDYLRDTTFITATQTEIPIFNPKGGFAATGSARIRQEQMGYATFQDSVLEGVARGGGGTTATSHTNIVSLEATVMQSGDGLVDLSKAFTDILSNVSYFTQDSKYLYLGASSKFPRLAVFNAINAPLPGINPQFEYSTGDGTWASALGSGFIPPFDETSGFTQAGNILFEPWGDWSPTNRVTSGGLALADATSRYFVRILRAASLGTFPKELEFTLEGDLEVSVRKANAFVYTPLAADSGQTLTFKAIATGVRGVEADGTKAPTAVIVEGA